LSRWVFELLWVLTRWDFELLWVFLMDANGITQGKIAGIKIPFLAVNAYGIYSQKRGQTSLFFP